MMRPSEDEIIARFFSPLAGPGALGLVDDAAQATPRDGHDLIASKDLLVAGVHFFADDPPDAIAAKALRVNLSDLAAKAAEPMGFLLGLGLPTDWTEPWLARFSAALADEATYFSCPLLGGDTVGVPGPLTLSVTVFGEVPKGRMVPRTGAKAGDRIYVSGTIGDSALGLLVRRDDPIDAAWLAGLAKNSADALRERYMRPEPRLALRNAMRLGARASMDISDGFIGDLGKMLRLAGLTTTIDVAEVPLSSAARAAVAIEPRLLQIALSGGDDYEILCTVSPERADAFEGACRETEVPMTAVGVAEPGDGDIVVRDQAGARLNYAQDSFRHFV